MSRISRKAQGRTMFFRMLARAAMLRKRSAVAALVATAVAAAAATAMLNLFSDVQGKLQREFRNFGANIVVEAPTGGSLSAAAAREIQAAVAGHGLAVPFAYAVARTDRDQAVVVGGTDLELARKLNPWWVVSTWPTGPHQSLVGVRAAAVVSPAMRNIFTLHREGRYFQLSPAGTLHTGAGEDSRVYISLEDFRTWIGLDPSVMEIAADGSSEQVNTLLQTLQRSFPTLDVRAVRQVAEGEANVLGKTRSTLLISSTFVVCTAALCVLATLMGWIFDRRRDFAIMKALGASDGMIAVFVAGEAAVLAFAGAILGFSGGIAIAAWIGRANFHAPVTPRFELFPAILAGCLVVTLASTVPPLRLLRRIQPAMILRGE
jgi:putative ABC transport system permease protein